MDSVSDVESALSRMHTAAQSGAPYEMCFVKWDISHEMQQFAVKMREEAGNTGLKIILTGQDQDELDDHSRFMQCRCCSVPAGIPLRSCGTHQKNYQEKIMTSGIQHRLM